MALFKLIHMTSSIDDFWANKNKWVSEVRGDHLDHEVHWIPWKKMLLHSQNSTLGPQLNVYVLNCPALFLFTVWANKFVDFSFYTY